MLMLALNPSPDSSENPFIFFQKKIKDCNG